MDEAAERIVARPGDHRAAPAVPGRGDGDVGGAAAEELAERLDLIEADPDLEGVDVDADAPHGQDVEARGLLLAPGFHGVNGSPSEPATRSA